MELFTERGASPMLIAQQMETFDSPDWIYELKMGVFQIELTKYKKRSIQSLSMLK